MFFNRPRLTNNMPVPPNIYSPPVSYPAYVILPTDGDPFIAASANTFEIGIYDRNMYLLEAAIKNPTTSGIKAYSFDGLTIVVEPFVAPLYDGTTYYFMRQDIPLTISAADLVPAGAFANTTRYYVYANVTAGVTKVVISTGAPHAYLLYKDNAGTQDKTNKYLFTFFTDSTGKIQPFKKDGRIYKYTKDTTETHVVVDGTAAVFTNITWGICLPSFAKIVTCNANFYNGEPLIGNTCLFGAAGSNNFITAGLDGFVPSINTISTPVELPVSPGQYKIISPGAMATPSKLNLFVRGFID